MVLKNVVSQLSDSWCTGSSFDILACQNYSTLVKTMNSLVEFFTISQLGIFSPFWHWESSEWALFGLKLSIKETTVTCQINVHNVEISIDFNVFSCPLEKLSCPTYFHDCGVI